MRINRKNISKNAAVINGEVQPIGRYPKASAANGGYLSFESHSGDGQITDYQLTDLPNWTGAEIVIRKNNWVIDKTKITSHTGSILYTGVIAGMGGSGDGLMLFCI